jgi:hypothetical protein
MLGDLIEGDLKKHFTDLEIAELKDILSLLGRFYTPERVVEKGNLGHYVPCNFSKTNRQYEGN